MFFGKKPYDYEILSNKITSILAQDSLPDKLYQDILSLVATTVKGEGAVLVLKDDQGFSVRRCLHSRQYTFSLNDFVGLVEWFQKNRRMITRQQILEEVGFSSIKQQALNFFIQFQAEACVPVLTPKEGLIGFIALGNKKHLKPYTPSCCLIVEWFAAQFSLILQNALLKEKLRSQTASVQEVKDLKSQIVANLSHELRTPLTSILGFAELLNEEIDGTLNEEQKKHVQQILKGGNRLFKILSAFVDMARLESRQLPLNIQQFHLLPLITSMLDEIPLHGNLSLQIWVDKKTPKIYGDLYLIRQVFKNLLDNAAKYTPKGRIEISADKKGEMLEICVADTGIGIGEGQMAHVFDGFYQVSQGLSREYQGPGLGLSLTKKFVELHGGRVWVKSQLGRGSKFYFTLPLKPIGIKHRELAA